LEKKIELQEIEAAKKGSVLQLLFKCARLANDQALARLRETTGNQSVRQAHTALFPHIDFEGTRTTTIAAKLGISKQAVSQLIAELEEMGMVERLDDPSDGRAKLVRFSAEGRKRILRGLDVLQEVANDLEAEVGADSMAQLHETLLKMEVVLERSAKD
jgi:DNA-binding MarR family transcriptional regulator